MEQTQTNIPVVKTKTNLFNMSLGIIGLVLITYGVFLPPFTTQKGLFLVGTFFLLLSSILEKNRFFAILETVVLCGTAIAFAPVSPMIKTAVPIGLSIIALISMIKKSMLRNYISTIGGLGLSFMALGFAISMPVVYLPGAIFLTLYSCFSYSRGIKIAALFAILNFILAITIIIEMCHI